VHDLCKRALGCWGSKPRAASDPVVCPAGLFVGSAGQIVLGVVLLLLPLALVCWAAYLVYDATMRKPRKAAFVLDKDPDAAMVRGFSPLTAPAPLPAKPLSRAPRAVPERCECVGVDSCLGRMC
jgi:hypothetical protein